jgi:uncharacterized protein YbcI
MHGTPARATPRPRGELSNAISDVMVRLVTEYTGRGPTTARSYLHDDLISVVMQDTLTKGERRLVEDGKCEHVRQTRRYFQDAMRGEVISAVEELTGRRVVAFLSDNHIDPDVAVETILLQASVGGYRATMTARSLEHRERRRRAHERDAEPERRGDRVLLAPR